ncbi:MAG: hypothetical protein B7733_03830 [Myxococcales bacterium FL481]|nr:MAG: hypothetical protein B7733_03830 [Myxococcales bacterium FL481]
MKRACLALCVSALAGGSLLAACVPPSCPDLGSVGGGGAGDDDDEGSQPFPDFERLEERNTDHCLVEGDACEGFPDANSEGYGFAKGQTLENWAFLDCEGEEREFAELLNQRPDNEQYNKGFLVALGAGWCGPCKDESKHLAEIHQEYRDQQIEFVHVLHQTQQPGSPATQAVCTWWDSEISKGGYMIWYDPTDTIDEAMKETVLDAIPYVVLADANANVRLRQPPPSLTDSQLSAALQQLINDPYGD